MQTVDQDEEGHKILKQAKEESETIYAGFETALNGMIEQLKKNDEQKAMQHQLKMESIHQKK